jgi:hemerythrin-like domain-containing protein
MQPRGLLMIEHRLILRMISLIDKEVKSIESGNGVNASFIDSTVDFIRFYADRTHHGKEENILFRDLAKKELSSSDKTVMKELIDEHAYGREVTSELVASAGAYQKGDTTVVNSITQNLRKFVGFYPNHIDKEERIFFPSTMGYFTEPERQSMLAEFREFDGKMIHDRYKSIVDALEK